MMIDKEFKKLKRKKKFYQMLEKEKKVIISPSCD